MAELIRACESGNLDALKKLIKNGKSPRGIRTDDSCCDTLLHIACRRADVDVAKVLINSGCSTSATNDWGSTPLHYACMHGSVVIAKVLINSGCRTSATTDLGSTPLHHACSNGQLEVVKMLIEEHHCDVNAQNIFGYTPLHEACMNGHHELVTYLIGGAHCNTTRTNKYGETPLHKACEYGQLSIVQLLIQSYKCNPSIADHNGATPLHFACANGHPEVVKMLIEEHHCDVNCKNNFGDTLLHLACRDGHLRIVQLLIENYNYNTSITNRYGDTALYYACKKGDLKIVTCLVSEAHCDTTTTNRDGNTPLHIACGYGHLSIVQLLIENYTCNPSIANGYGSTPLHYACMKLDLKIVTYLVGEAHCDTTTTNRDGNTPLHLACRYGWGHSAEYLIQHMSPTWTDSRGWTLLHFGCQYRCLKSVQYLVEDRSCNPSCTDKEGNTPLHIACEKGDLKIVTYLVGEAHCDTTRTNKYGDTPLHLACEKGHSDVVNYFMEHMSATWSDGEGWSLLHYACWYGYIDAITHLLKEGKINPDCTSRDGRTPLSLTDSIDILRKLLRHGATADYELWKKHGPSKEQPVIKAFIVGDAGAGKSTLTKALETKSKGLSFITNRVLKVSDVDQKTAGIVPHDIENKEFGRLTLYDFAGQKEFYAGHDAVLRSAVSGSSAAIFLIVADLCTSDKEFTERIRYWLTFLENQEVSADPTPHMMIVGSHADLVKVKKDIEGKRHIVEALQQEKVFASFHYVGFVALDCQYAISSSMSQLRQYLADSCEELRNKSKMSSRNHCFLVYLLDKFRGHPAVQIKDVSARVAEEATLLGSLPARIPEDAGSISQLCDEVSKTGNLLFFKSAQSIESSWIILDREALFSRVTGTVFAPKDFKEHCDLATSTGVVPFSKIHTHFPRLDTDMITQFLCHLEFCHEVVDSETLQLIKPSEGSDSAEISFDPIERFFFFPGLVSIEVPSGVWENSLNFNYLCGWALQCITSGQFFTPRFLQVLLLRLAFSLALAPHEHTSTKVPALQRNCQVWKNGICWGDESGVEALVEVKENKSVMVMVRCLKGSEVECARVQSIVIGKIQQITKTFCRKVTVSEYLLYHCDSKQYPPKPLSELALVNVEDIAAALMKQKPSIVKPGKVIPLSEILGFEPYTSPGVNILQHLFGNQTVNSVLQQLFGGENPACNKYVPVTDRPTLPQLLSFPCAERKVNIPVEIGTKYVRFGTLILEDANGAKVSNMEHKYQRDPERINTEILQEWLNGKGKQPVTWATLIEILHDICY